MDAIRLFDQQISIPSYRPTTAWLRHGPFAMWLVGAARPKRLVELGSHMGFSYFAFCEAVQFNKIDTKCFAIDTWKGDEHAGFYEDNVFEAVSAANAKYEGFSTLVRKTFAEALDDFEDGSIDVLHVDGRHFYEDVKEDFESWIPKLADDAIVLFHDTEVYERDFGVWKYWAELREAHQTMNFPYQHGLGVLFRGGDLSPELKQFREAASTEFGRDMLIATFAAAGDVLARTVGFNVATAAADEKHAELTSEKAHLTGVLETAHAELEVAVQRVVELEAENASLRHELVYSLSHAHRALKEYIAFKVLRAAAKTSLPVSDRTRERLARSTSKRDPKRYLEKTYQDYRLRREKKKKGSDVLKKAEIALLLGASQLTATLAPRHSAKFKRSAEKRSIHVAAMDTAANTSDLTPLPTVSESYTLCSRPLSLEADVLVLVLFSADGRLSELHRYQISCYLEAGFTLVLVINTPLHVVAPTLIKGDMALEGVAIAIVRENKGFDFAAWGHALMSVGKLDAQNSLSFTNDSVIPISTTDLRRLRRRISDCSGAAFLTENREVRQHSQSYFFGFGNPAEVALNVLRDTEIFDDKDKLINNVEVHFSDKLRAVGVEIENLFPLAEADDQGRNPTIHFWKTLIEKGFPFLKVQLFSAGLLKPTDTEVERLIGSDVVRMLESHLDSRNGLSNVPDLDFNCPPVPALPISTRFSKIGAMQAYNPPADARPAFLLPLNDTAIAPCVEKQVLVVLHAFYPEIAEKQVKRLVAMQAENCGASFRFVLTTDCEKKAHSLRSIFGGSSYGEIDLQVTVGLNRGRDIAPFLAACAEHIAMADDLVLHLHTKKSLHDGNLKDWGDYLFDCLAGSPELIRSTMQLFDEPKLGIVYPGHFEAISGLRNWGFDFPHAHALMQQMGCDLRADDILDFPTGSMFWARPAALRPLFKLGLTPEDFEPEAGQTDGTLAHAIERILVHVAEAAGYKAQAVVADRLREKHLGTEISMTVANARAYLGRVQAILRHFARPRSNFSNSIREVYDVSTGRSDSDRPRLNVILPTIQPEKIFGGVSTALHVANKLWNAHGGIDLRLLITSDSTDLSGLNEVSRRLNSNFTLSAPEDDGDGTTVVSLRHQPFRPISLRRNDYFMSTAWWTANLGFRLHDAQVDYFGASPKMAYLIQDYEPGFYKWSNQYSMALNTYARPDDTIALINSEELCGFMSKRHDLTTAFCLPFTLEPRLAQNLRITRKERIILVYARPSVERNAFDIIVEGLRQWQMYAPENAKSWQIVMAGEDFDARLLVELENASVVGKLSLSEYSAMLNRAAVGVSMMISPHPSYPPLEMASAGVLTLTNMFENKDLSKRAPNITSIATVSPEAIAVGVERLTNQIEIEKQSEVVEIEGLPSPYPHIDFDRVARLQQSFEKKSK